MNTPDTTNYLIGGFAVFAVTFFGYLASIYIRWQNLMREKQNLEELEK